MERRSAEKRPPFGMWDRDLLEEAYCMYMPLNHQVSSISALRNAQGHGIATQREWISRQGDALAEALEHVDDAFFRVATSRAPASLSLQLCCRDHICQRTCPLKIRELDERRALCPTSYMSRKVL